MTELLIATNNRGKIRELERLLAGMPLTLRSLKDFGIDEDVAETGSTFTENAMLKAAGYAGIAGIPTIADDSGLVVDHLDGKPGVQSARYAGEDASDAARVEKVLAELRGAANGLRTARFVCVVAFADPQRNVRISVEGICEGTIVDGPRGASGFGYDPIFQPAGFIQTFAELPSDTKNRISHRAQAVAKIIPFLRAFLNI